MENYRKYFTRITRTAQRYYNLHVPGGLKAQETLALRVISFHQELSQQSLADHLGVDKAEVTRLVNKLEAGGYLTRTVNPKDRRERLIASTPKADAEKEHGIAVTDHFYSWLLSDLPPAEKEQFTATLQKLFDRASAARADHFKELEDFPCT